MEAIAGVTSLAQGRITGDEYHTDWSEDTLFIDGSTVLFYTLVQSSQHWPYSIVSEISVVLSPASTLKFQQYVDADLDWWGKLAILQSIFVIKE